MDQPIITTEHGAMSTETQNFPRPRSARGIRRPRPGGSPRLHEGHRLRRRRAQAARRSASPTPGSRRCRATSTCAGLAEHIKEGVRAAGGTPMEFNTIAISDGITMGTKGMKSSLVSREVIADSIELTVRGYQFDAVIALRRLRQDDARLRDGAGPARHPLAAALRRIDRARPLQGPRRHHPRRLRRRSARTPPGR